MADRVELIQGDARETIEAVDRADRPALRGRRQGRVPRYIELAEPKLSERARAGRRQHADVGRGRAADGRRDSQWRAESLSAARALNAELLDSDRWLACVLPVGDGIALGAAAAPMKALLAVFAVAQLVLGALLWLTPGFFFDEIGPYGVRNDHYMGDLATWYLALGARGAGGGAGAPAGACPCSRSRSSRTRCTPSTT